MASGVEQCSRCGYAIELASRGFWKDRAGEAYCADGVLHWPADDHEAQLREHRRMIAAIEHSENQMRMTYGLPPLPSPGDLAQQAALAQARRNRSDELRELHAIPDAEGVIWRDGTCSGCGLDDLPVTGPGVAPLCPYCNQLDIMAPLPKQPPSEALAWEPVIAALKREKKIRNSVSSVFVITAWLMYGFIGGTAGLVAFVLCLAVAVSTSSSS